MNYITCTILLQHSTAIFLLHTKEGVFFLFFNGVNNTRLHASHTQKIHQHSPLYLHFMFQSLHQLATLLVSSSPEPLGDWALAFGNKISGIAQWSSLPAFTCFTRPKRLLAADWSKAGAHESSDHGNNEWWCSLAHDFRRTFNIIFHALLFYQPQQ